MKSFEAEELPTFKPSFNSRNSLMDNFDKNFQVLKSLGSFTLSEKDVKDAKQNDSMSYLPSKEYSLKTKLLSNSKPQHEISQKYSIKLEAEVMSVRFNPQSSLLACGLNNGSVVLLDNENASVLKTLTASFEKFSVNSVRWKPNNVNNNIITAASTDGYLICYNLTTNKFIYKANPRKGMQLLCMDYNQEGKTLAMGTNGGNIIIWNEFAQKEERLLESGNWFNNGHSNRVFSVKFVADEPNMLLSGGWEKLVFLWDLRDPKVK